MICFLLPIHFICPYCLYSNLVPEPTFVSKMSTSDSSSSSFIKAESKTYSLFSSSSQVTSVKLDRGNFLIWESLVLTLIQGNRLDWFINGTTVAPPRQVPSPTIPAAMVNNPEFDDWFVVDRMLVGWLRNSMSPEIQAQLLHCSTAHELWQNARSLTAATSQARIMEHTAELNTDKEGMTMESYLAKMKNAFDQLALAGSPISTKELVMHTLNGLDKPYNSIVAPLLGKDVSWNEKELLLSPAKKPAY